MVWRNSEGTRKWENIGHQLIHTSDLFLLCEQDRNDPEAELPFIAVLLPHGLYGMITFILKRMREIDAQANMLLQQFQDQRGLLPLQYRGREQQYFRMRIPKTRYHRSSELYNAEFVNDTDDGFDSCQGVFVTLERALGYLFDEILFRFGSPPEKFVSRILMLYPEYEAIVVRKIKEAQLSCRQETALPSSDSSPVPQLNIRLSQEELMALYHELAGFFNEDDHELLMQLLQGGTSERKLLFKGNQNRLVEVFRRLKYNGFLFETSTGIRDWLCNNFLYLSKTGARNLNPHSVWDILSKAKGEPSPRSRICRLEWLEYKTPPVFK